MISEDDILAANILIVDDEAANVRLMERLLTEAGYSRVASTSDPTTVRELHRKNHYDLMLLDLRMPGMDGFAVMEALKTDEQQSYVPVIVLSAQSSEKLRALQAGAKDFISKPFDLVEVKTRIHNMLEVRLLHNLLRDQNQLLDQAVHTKTAELRELAGYLLTAREDERANLARELHDELGALLTVAKLDVSRLRARLAGDPAVAVLLVQLNERLDAGIALKRRIVEDLRPTSLATLGLTISLAELCTDMGKRLNIAIQIELDEVVMADDGNLAIYRLVQEALTNVAKYAKATQVSVSVRSEPNLVRVRIEDDGIGFDATGPRLAAHGIAGMRFRIERLMGSMSLDTSPGAGTRLEAIVPAALAAAVAG